MSPIAAASFRESDGRPVKGSGRRVNGLGARPSVWLLLSTTGTIESLAAMRAEIVAGVASGEITPDAKTLLRWNEALWTRVLELMALQPRNAPFIVNLTLPWPKPPGLQEALEAQMKLVTASLPPDAERAGGEGQKAEDRGQN